MSIDKPALDLGYRPESYFWPITHETHRIAAIKGGVVTSFVPRSMPMQ
jgi:hypothetical protein